jgi:hypothetical protein
MKLLLVLVLVVGAFMVFRRFQVAIRGQRLVAPPDAAPGTQPEQVLPLLPSDQVHRATRAADGTHTQSQHRPEPEEGPPAPF